MRTKTKARAPRLVSPAHNGNGHVIAEPLKLDLGCGPSKREGFKGVDLCKFNGVDFVVDLTKRWPWADNSVEEAYSSHFIEHLDPLDRIHFCNELWRVLKPGGKCQIIAPDWSSGRAYGDLTHKWPPISSFWFNYLLKEWRMANAPHDDISWNPKGYSCDFEHTGGYMMHPSLNARNQEYQQYALQFLKEACQDVFVTWTARK